MGAEAVVVLFTDLVGSTERSMAESPEGADQSRRAHFTTLRRAVADAGGTEVKNLGDGLMVVFTSASAAIACAVAMQQGIEAADGGQGPGGLRVGVSAGEATVEDGDYFGDPVIEAARLCAAADGGQILAADVVRLMAGRRNPHRCTPLGGLDLKGLPAPLEAVAVHWERLDPAGRPGQPPLPGRLAEAPDIGVVGRDRDRRGLAAALDRVSRDGREVVLVTGEAGVGKTTLVADAARRAHRGGACVLFGSCEEDLATPYQLFAEALGHYLVHAPDEEIDRHVAAHGAGLCALVPGLASRRPGLAPPPATDAGADSERYVLFAAALGLIEQVARDGPLVLVLDDLQWADQGSLVLLRHLVAAEQLGHVLVIATYRAGELSPGHPLLDALAAVHRHPGVSRIELGGMDDFEVVAFMAAAAGHSLDRSALELARAVHRETEGNAFFVAEVLRHLSETGVIAQDDTGTWAAEVPVDEIPLPTSVHEVVGSRVGRLGETARHALGVAAVIGRDFDLELLARAIDRPTDEVLDLLDRAIRANLVRESTEHPGIYRFSHALVQHVLYADLGLTRQARLHRVVGQALDDLCAGRPDARIGERARHWASTGLAADGSKAVDYARRAGDAALAALAPAVALDHYRQAIARAATLDVADPVLDVDLGIGLGTAQRQVGDLGFRQTLLDAARRAAALDDTGRLVVAALANSRGWFSASGAVDQEKVDILRMARERLPEPTEERALILATLCAELTFHGSLAQREALADEAVAIAQATGSDATVVRVLNQVVFPLLVPSQLGRGLTRTAEALERAERLGDPLQLYFAAMYRATVATRAGDVEEVDRCYALAGELARRLDQPSVNWEHTFHLAKRAQIAGDVDEAERLAAEALQIGLESGQPDAETFFGVQLAAVSWQRGTMGDLAPLLEQMVLDSPGLPTIKASLALAFAEQERLGEARRMLDEFAATGYDLPVDAAWLNGMTEYAEAAIACGDPGHAAALAERLTPWADQFSSAGGVTAEGPVRLVLGGLAAVRGLGDEADEHYARSTAWCDRVGARFFGARTALLWGQMLAGRDDPDARRRAQELLSRARAEGAGRGYLGLERRAAAALAAMA